MTDREKVISELKSCLDDSIAAVVPNDTVMYAIALLKEQEPRVMHIDEIKALDNGSVVWIEFSDGRLLPMIVEDGCLMRWAHIWKICDDAFHDEDYMARAWSSRPTDEQRKEVEWYEIHEN